jgi:hypothetical protein
MNLFSNTRDDFHLYFESLATIKLYTVIGLF